MYAVAQIPLFSADIENSIITSMNDVMHIIVACADNAIVNCACRNLGQTRKCASYLQPISFILSDLLF